MAGDDSSRAGRGALVPGTWATIEAVSDHIRRYVGVIDQVFHEIESPEIHVDIHHVPPSSELPYTVLVTSGMSDLPMAVPDGSKEYRFAELFALLPPEWPLTAEAFQREESYWPVRLLKTLARYPHDNETWLGYGHSIGNAGVPFAPDTRLCGVLLTTPISVASAFGQLVISADRSVHFWQAIPLYQQELEFKIEHGAEALFDLFQNAGVSDVISPDRLNVCAAGGRTRG